MRGFVTIQFWLLLNIFCVHLLITVSDAQTNRTVVAAGSALNKISVATKQNLTPSLAPAKANLTTESSLTGIPPKSAASINTWSYSLFLCLLIYIRTLF